MSDFISRLQAKPKKTRKKIAFGTASLVTFFIFLFWIVSISGTVPGKEYADVSPFKNLGSNIAGAASALQSSFSSLGENVKESFQNLNADE